MKKIGKIIIMVFFMALFITGAIPEARAESGIVIEGVNKDVRVNKDQVDVRYEYLIGNNGTEQINDIKVECEEPKEQLELNEILFKDGSNDKILSVDQKDGLYNISLISAVKHADVMSLVIECQYDYIETSPQSFSLSFPMPKIIGTKEFSKKHDMFKIRLEVPDKWVLDTSFPALQKQKSPDGIAVYHTEINNVPRFVKYNLKTEGSELFSSKMLINIGFILIVVIVFGFVFYLTKSVPKGSDK